MRVLHKPPEAIARQKVVCVGAGSAGMGVVRMIAAGKSCLPLDGWQFVLLQLPHWERYCSFGWSGAGHEATNEAFGLEVCL
jgi:hypothetical protein